MEQQLVRRHAVRACERGAQFAAERVRVAVQLRQHRRHRFYRARAGPKWIFVRAQFAQAQRVEAPAQRDDVQARVVSVQRAHGGLGEGLEVGRLAAQSSATG